LFVHANAALSFRQRVRLIELVGGGRTITAAARLTGCSRQTASKWVGRHRRGEGFADRSSRPHRSPRQTAARIEQAVLNTRRRLGVGPHPIGWELGLAASTVHAILRRHGQSRLNQQAKEPVVRYERERPGELIHVDIKRLGRIQHGAGCRFTGPAARSKRPTRKDPLGVKRQTAGWECVHIAIDDCTRLAYAEVLADQSRRTVIGFLRRAVKFYARHGITVQRVMTDNGGAYRSTIHAAACRTLGIRHLRTRAYRPQTNGKAERFNELPPGRLGLRRDLSLERRAHRRP